MPTRRAIWIWIAVVTTISLLVYLFAVVLAGGEAGVEIGPITTQP
jgi:hypothetical protein